MADRGFSVLGVPCNQFLEQEPGNADEIASFCSINYGVSFPMSEKVDVNGDARHSLYSELSKVTDAEAEQLIGEGKALYWASGSVFLSSSTFSMLTAGLATGDMVGFPLAVGTIRANVPSRLRPNHASLVLVRGQSRNPHAQGLPTVPPCHRPTKL